MAAPVRRQQLGKARVDTTGHSDKAADLIVKLQSQAQECIICMGVLHRGKSLWSCPKCYCLMHPDCVRQWAKRSSDPDGVWHCPHCQAPNSGAPELRCYCGRVADPPFDPYAVANSCGEKCGKPRGGVLCPHKCSL